MNLLISSAKCQKVVRSFEDSSLRSDNLETGASFKFQLKWFISYRNKTKKQKKKFLPLTNNGISNLLPQNLKMFSYQFKYFPPNKGSRSSNNPSSVCQRQCSVLDNKLLAQLYLAFSNIYVFKTLHHPKMSLILDFFFPPIVKLSKETPHLKFGRILSRESWKIAIFTTQVLTFHSQTYLGIKPLLYTMAT